MTALRVILLVLVCASLAQAQLPPTPPPPVFTNTPVVVFRRLLAMDEGEREKFIGSRAKEAQPLLRAKVQEYLALPPATRESRLQSLELRALLLPLMSMSETDRAVQIAQLPPEKRKVVQGRLATWSIMPPPLAKDVLENEVAVRFFLDTVSADREELLRRMSPQQRAELESGIDRLNKLPEGRRQMAAENVARFFGSDSSNRAETLSALSDKERSLVTNALARLSKLAPEERTQAVAGLRKFKELSPVEQQQFLRSAARWQSMSEKDRQTWRELVARTRSVMMPPPPMPADARTRRVSSSSQ